LLISIIGRFSVPLILPQNTVLLDVVTHQNPHEMQEAASQHIGTLVKIVKRSNKETLLGPVSETARKKKATTV